MVNCFCVNCGGGTWVKPNLCNVVYAESNPVVRLSTIEKMLTSEITTIEQLREDVAAYS